jgi:hypothetical protein
VSLVVAGLISIMTIKVLSSKKEQASEVCPSPFYGSEEIANAFAEARARRLNEQN